MVEKKIRGAEVLDWKVRATFLLGLLGILINLTPSGARAEGPPYASLIDKFLPGIARLLVPDSDDGGNFCTTFKVQPYDWVTSSHCVDGLESGETILINSDPRTSANLRRLSVTAVRRAPDRDLAVINVKDETEGIPSLPFSGDWKNKNASSLTGTLAIVAGFPFSNRGEMAIFLTTPIRDMFGWEGFLISGWNWSWRSDASFLLAGQVDDGHSGSPVFIGSRPGAMDLEVRGVVSASHGGQTSRGTLYSQTWAVKSNSGTLIK